LDEAVETVGGKAAAVVPWARQGGGGHCLREVGAVRMQSARGLDRAADGGPHAVLIFFNLTKIGSNLKFEKNALLCSKNSQIVHAARLGHYDQFSQLFRHPNLNRIRVKIPGIDSPFENLMNF
jgi:hypothetical protein